MSQTELREKYLQVYSEIHNVKGLYDILMAVMRDNEGEKEILIFFRSQTLSMKK